MLEVYSGYLINMQKRFDAATGQRDLLEKQLTDAEAQLMQAKTDIVTWEAVQILLGKVSEFARTQMISHIEGIVSAALLAVFGEGYTFRIAMRTVGNQAAAEWQVVSSYGDTEVAASPEDSRGGGVVDVVSLALRLAMMELLRPRIDGPLILDEPAKMLSRQHTPNLAYFLKQYAAKANRQILMVSHDAQLVEAADKSYLVTQENGISEVREIGR